MMASILSVMSTSSGKFPIEIIFAVDDDDANTLAVLNGEHFKQVFAKYHWVSHRVEVFKRLGYNRLNEYLNATAPLAKHDLIWFWNDDASMMTRDWDVMVEPYRDFPGTIKIQTVNHQHLHPELPIVHKSWLDNFGCFSPITYSDSWISLICCYLGNAMVTVPAFFYHHRGPDMPIPDSSNDRKDPTNPQDVLHPKNQLAIQQARPVIFEQCKKYWESKVLPC
jgi:hypothetical protein